jgi:hypothetical protein
MEKIEQHELSLKIKAMFNDERNKTKKEERPEFLFCNHTKEVKQVLIDSADVIFNKLLDSLSYCDEGTIRNNLNSFINDLVLYVEKEVNAILIEEKKI